MINIGELRSRLSIYSIENTIDENTGIEVPKEVLKCSLRCKMKTISSKEFYENSASNAEVVKRFIVRYRKDIKLDDVIVFDEEKYDIKNISEIDGYKTFLEIIANWRKI